MTEGPSAPFWGQDWIDASQRQWDAWRSFMHQAGDAGASAAGGARPQASWADALETWWRLATPPGPPQSRQLLDHLVEQGRLFLRFGEELAGLSSRTGGLPSADDWRRSLQALADGWASTLGPHPGAGLAAFWKLPFDTWNRTVSSASIFPGDPLESHKPDTWAGLADGVQRDLERFLSVPGLGYTREVQEQGQELARLALEYQRALHAYADIFRTWGLDTLERVQVQLTKRAERREPVTTLRGLYDLWVDASEEAYLELVATDGYAEAYGRMVNALMALKNHGRNMADEVVGALGLPTRHTFTTLQRQQQELRRETATLRRELGDLQALRREVAELGREVQDLGARTPRQPPARRRRAPKSSGKHSKEV